MCRPDDFPPYDLPTRLTRDVQYAADHVEGVSVFVVTDDEHLALEAAPLLAATLYPGDDYGDVLHVERQVTEVTGFEVVLRVIRGVPADPDFVACTICGKSLRTADHVRGCPTQGPR